jgi:hypothetical protein
MNTKILRHPARLFLALATLAAFTCAPLASEALAYDPVKKVKVKDHKVKVKAIDGKAKIKNKPNGKQKTKVKGPNGAYAADIAYSTAYGNASPSCDTGSGYYK